MHILTIVEGYHDDIQRFKTEFHGKLYNNGKAKLRVREVVFLTNSINESGAKEYLEELSGYATPFKGDKINKLGSIIRFFGRFFGLKKVKNITPNLNVIKPRSEGGNPFNCHFVILGVIPDARSKEGKEQV